MGGERAGWGRGGVTLAVVTAAPWLLLLLLLLL